MPETVKTNTMTIAPGVVDRVIQLAAEDVEGVASVSSYVSGGLLAQMISRAKGEAISTSIDEDGSLHVKIHVMIYYGYSIPKLAAQIRQSIADALLLQTGIQVGQIDIRIESCQLRKSA
jgi:uncharacterized alkaline shock family protein YloU